MKTLKGLTIIAALLLAPLANAATYKGTWNNKTFKTSGDLTIDFTVRKTSVIGSFDFDGPVFGAGDPPAIPFNAKLNAKGNGSFKVLGTGVGDIAGSFNQDGKLTISITNIPGGFLTIARVNGKFDLNLETFTASYFINTAAGRFANGTAEANVPKRPTIRVPRTVAVKGSTRAIKANVITNTGIKVFKATANKGARVRVIGKNPYRIAVTRLTAKKTIVKIAVVNDDGLRSVKYVRLIKK